jgi:ACR3 family arsenite transporter
MILPMMLQIDFHSVVVVVKAPKPIVLCAIINYAIQPFTMYAISLLFFKVFFESYLGTEKSDGYVIGAVLLGGAPCTAMVFVWSVLMNGNAAYTLAQVAVNDILLLILYVPTVKLLASASNIEMPWDTLLYSVGLFIVVPLVVAVVTRQSLNQRGLEWLKTKVIPLLDTLSMAFLLLMVVLIFISQAATITKNWVDILIIAIPLTVQTVLIWGLTYAVAIYFEFPFDIAGPASLIACSNFFEMAVAIAVSIYGTGSPATLATVVGVLIEVPVMLVLVAINNKTQHKFAKGRVLLE